MSNRKRIDELWAQRQELYRQIGLLDKERKRLEDDDLKAEHPCQCVRLNRDIGVHDMGELARKQRQTLEAGGLVSEGYSADRNCARCGGTGMPK